MVDNLSYERWLDAAAKDLQGAKILFEHDADYGIVCFHCQQSIEKLLKGYLISQTGMLHNGHGLVKLCKSAEAFDKSFKDMQRDFALVDIYYIETRYPAVDPLVVSKENAQTCIDIAQKALCYIIGN